MNERKSDNSGLAELLLPHLDSAYNLARWLVRNVEDAEDVVQESYLRAFQYARGFRGGDSRAWLLTIVRNTSYRWLQKTRGHEPVTQFDEERHTSGRETSNPEQLLLQSADGRIVEKAMSGLPVRFREILVLRELECLSYREISDVMGVPIGTVMSTLSRARDRFRLAAADLLRTHVSPRPRQASARDRVAVEARTRTPSSSIGRTISCDERPSALTEPENQTSDLCLVGGLSAGGATRIGSSRGD